MAIVFSDTFDQLSGVPVSRRGLALGISGYASQGTFEMMPARPSLIKPAGLAIRLRQAPLTRTFVTAPGDQVIGFAARAEATATVFDANGALTLTLGETAVLNGVRGARALRANEWVFVELVMLHSSRKVELWVNDRLDATLAMPPPLVGATSLSCAWGDATSLSKEVDDIYVVDSSVTPTDSQRSRLGPIEVEVCPVYVSDTDGWEGPTNRGDYMSDYSAQFGPVVTSHRANSVQSFMVFQASYGPVISYGMNVLASKGEADGRLIDMTIGRHDARNNYRFRNLAVTPTEQQVFFDHDFDGSDWTANRIFATPLGATTRQ